MRNTIIVSISELRSLVQDARRTGKEYVKLVTMPPAAAQMMMKAVDFLFSVHISLKLLYPYSGDTSTLQSTL